jgi:phage terminase large subunit GpA-like protein
MSLAIAEFTTAIHEELTWCVRQAKAQITRPISQWVEEELILPGGPFRGERYRHSRHPASRPWFEAVDSLRWNRFAASGPTQNGKTLMCYVAPILYHLFEIQETVVIGMPTMQMAQDKWLQDLLPAIEATRFASLLPVAGEGSRGGQVKRAIRFAHGVSLRFMASGGSDKQRAGFETRVAALTEVDGMDQAGSASREADKVEQIEGRTRAHGADKRIYMECTASIENGRIWQEIKQGTDSRIARPCPHCKVYVTPEREHLSGWQDAESEIEAADKSFWACPECGKAWTEKERHGAAEQSVLVHRGQKVFKNGRVVGEPPPTKTLGFRWSAIDNPFTTAAELGAEEWRAKRSVNHENAEKKMRQFVWCLPYDPPEVELTPLSADQVQGRAVGLKKGAVPDDCVGISIGVDTGKQVLHWEANANRTGGGAAVIEYGDHPVDSNRLGTIPALVQALRELWEYYTAGWQNKLGRLWTPSQVWIDSGWHEHKAAIYQFCRVANQGLQLGSEIYRPAKGFGEGQKLMTRYVSPKAKGGDVLYIGREYHMTRQRADKVLLVHVNADHWKTDFHQRLAMPAEEPTAITLYQAASPTEHLEYSRQVTAERQIEKWFPGRGTKSVWERVDRENHFLDAGYLATAAGHFVLAESQKKPTAEKWIPQAQTPSPVRRGGQVEADGWVSE